jgi:hypothetical protein
VPEGKALFFPILVYTGWAPTDGETEEEVRATANFFMDPSLIQLLECTIDGVAIQDLYSYRAESPVGTLGENDMTDVPDGSDILLADGYWLLLEPLDEGDYVIHFRGAVGPDPDEIWFALDVTYLITVSDDDDDDEQ